MTTAEKEVQTSPWVPPTQPRPEIDEKEGNEITNKAFSAMTDEDWCCHCDTRHIKEDDPEMQEMAKEELGESS